jgi:hypothetical protein
MSLAYYKNGRKGEGLVILVGKEQVKRQDTGGYIILRWIPEAQNEVEGCIDWIGLAQDKNK